MKRLCMLMKMFVVDTSIHVYTLKPVALYTATATLLTDSTGSQPFY